METSLRAAGDQPPGEHRRLRQRSHGRLNAPHRTAVGLAGRHSVATQQVYCLDSYTGTDDQRMASALSALFAASPAGGTITLSPWAHTFADQWTTTYTAGTAVAVKIQGAGAGYNGAWDSPSGATTCTFTYGPGIERQASNEMVRAGAVTTSKIYR